MWVTKPLMLAQLTGVPVAVAPKRPQAVSLLLAEHAVDIIIADDGLQHYALGRQIEIAVVDGETRPRQWLAITSRALTRK